MSCNIPFSISKLKAEKCKRSLYYFVKEFWSVIIPDEMVESKHIKYICDKIQPEVLRAINKEKRIYDAIVINICPGTTKSTIISIMVPAWAWAVKSSSKVLSNTNDFKLSTKNASRSKDIITSNKYKLYFPDVEIRKDATAKMFYENTNGGARYSYTTKGSKIGDHGDLLIDDDPTTPKQAKSPVEMESANEGMKEFLTRMTNKKTSLYILLMQRLGENDSTTLLFSKFNNVLHICLPAKLSDKVKPDDAVEIYQDGYLDPIRLNQEILDLERKKLNNEEEGTTSFDFDAQFLQDPKNVKGYLYPNLKYFDISGDDWNSIGEDFSFTDVADRGEDYLCTIFAKIYNNNIYVYDVIYTQENTSITLPRMKDRFEYYNTSVNIIESNNQGSVVVTFLEEAGFPIMSWYSSGNKETRIITSSFYAKDIYFLKPDKSTNDEYKSFVQSLVRFPKNCKVKHDDGADALSIMIKFFLENYRHIFNNQCN